MANQQGQAFEDLRNTVNECLRIVRHRWKLSSIGLSIVASLAFWCSQYLPREYSASTLFERRDDVVLQNLIHSNSPYGFDHLKTTMSMDMTGQRALAHAMVTAELLPADAIESTDGALTETERAAVDEVTGKYKLRTDLRLVHSSNSLDTILLRCNGNDPEVARRLLIALRDNYIVSTRDRIHKILNGTSEFFASEVQRLQEKLNATDVALRKSFDELNGMDPTDLAAVGHRLEMLRGQRDAAYQQTAALEAEIAAREQFLTSQPAPYALAQPENATDSPNTNEAPVVSAPSDRAIEKAIEDTRREIVDLRTARRMTEEHPKVKAAVARLHALEELRDSLASLTPDPEDLPLALPEPKTPEVSEGFREWQAQQMRVQMELNALRRQASIADAQLADTDDRLERFENIYNRLLEEDGGVRLTMDKRTETTTELAVWQGHLARLERVLAAESGERGTQFTLIEEPQNVSQPTQPRVASIFMVCSGLGLAAAALLVALAELFDRSFRSTGQVTRVLGIPVLECIGVIPTPREKRKAAVSRLIWTPTLGLLLMFLVASAAMAYVSLRRPDLHERAMQRMDGVLHPMGMATPLPLGEHAE